MPNFIKATLISASALLLFISMGDARAQAPNPDALPTGVSVINGVNPNQSEEDLRVFDGAAKQAQIFGIGESAHGSTNYIRMQLRLVKYLIEHHGYRKLLLEVSTDDRRLNAYLLRHEGTLREALYLNEWVENTQPRLEFYEWLATYNKFHTGDPVTVAAVDTQKPWEDAPLLRAYLQRVVPSLVHYYSDRIEGNCLGAGFKNQIDWAFSAQGAAYGKTGTIPEEMQTACMQALDEVQNFFTVSRAFLINTSGPLAYGDTWGAIESLRSFQLKSYYLLKNAKKAIAIREAAFGPSVLWHWKKMDRHPQKAILIAHNVHLSKMPILPGDDEFGGSISLGSQLEKALGSSFKAFAQSGMHVGGAFGHNYVVPSSEDSLDLALHALNLPTAFVNTATADWLRARQNWSLQEEDAATGRRYPVLKAFDGVIFHEVSPPTTFLGKP